jgi:membrane protein required for colicin V production
MPEHLNWFDILMLVVLFASVVSGLKAGFARVTIGLISAVVGLLFALWFYKIPSAAIRPYLSSDTVASILGFVIVFGVVVAVGALAALILASIFKWIGLSWVDHLLGGAVGLLRGALVVAALVTAVVAFAPSPTPTFLNESRMLPYAESVASAIAAMAPKDLKDAFDQQLDNIKQFWPGAKPSSKPKDVHPNEV